MEQKYSLQTIKRLLGYIGRKYKGRFIAVLFFIVLSNAAGVIGSLFLEVLIDDYITPLIGVSNPDFASMLYAIGVMGIIYLIGIVSTYIYNLSMVTIGQGVQKEIRDELFSKMERLPIGYFDRNSFGDIMSRYTNDIDTLRQFLSQSVPQAFSSAITIVFVFVAMLYTNVPLTAFVIAMILVILIATRYITRQSRRYFTEQQKNIGKINGFIEEMMNGQKVIKVFSHEGKTKEQFDHQNLGLNESMYKANKYANVLMPVIVNLSNLAYVLVAIIGGFLLIGGHTSLTIGGVVAFLQLTKLFSQPIGQISQQLNSIVMGLSGAERIFSLMDEKPEENNGNISLVKVLEENGELVETDSESGSWAWKNVDGTGKNMYSPVRGDVVFDKVDFSYVPGKRILSDISLHAAPGQKIAFVGSTGAGKTTITNLLNRFYDIESGVITYDGFNIVDINKNSLRRSLGVVLQETNLFTATVKENIRYGKLDATDEEIYHAAKLANAHDFISRLPEGYDTVLSGDGSGLSQGQKQLLAIARAEIAGTPVMILDEATSSIDTRTEKLVQDGMDALMENRTVFVIAHRLSTVQNSNSIIVLEKGKIIERGDHETLIRQKGKYYQLYTGSFENGVML